MHPFDIPDLFGLFVKTSYVIADHYGIWLEIDSEFNDVSKSSDVYLLWELELCHAETGFKTFTV